MHRFRADCIIVSADRFIRGGTLVVDDGLVRDVVHTHQATVDREFRGCIIAPGLVNAHCHLDLSLFPPAARVNHRGDFFAWLREVIAYRRRASLDELTEAVRAGVNECLRYGVVAVGDVTTLGLPPASWHPLRGVLFGELLGTTAARIEEVKRRARCWLEAATAAANRRRHDRHISLSPHAPYSTATELYRWAARQCPTEPLTTHLLELPDEAELLIDPPSTHNSLVTLLQHYGAWHPEQLWTLPALFRFLAETPSRWIAAHANYVQPAQLRPLAERICVAYCPRTHAAFGHVRHPCRALLDAGIAVAIATDSKASAPNLSLLVEAQTALVRDRLEPTAVFRMITQVPAAALGLKRSGTLAPGAHADFIVVQPPGPIEDPIRSLLEPASRILATFIAGQAVYDLEAGT